MKLILLCLFFALHSNGQVYAQQPINPDTVLVHSDSFKLKALLWQPSGKGPFPAIIFCHGSYETTDTRYDLVQQISLLGQLFVSNGYIFLGLCRRGSGLSKGQGENSADAIARAFKKMGKRRATKFNCKNFR